MVLPCTVPVLVVAICVLSVPAGRSREILEQELSAQAGLLAPLAPSAKAITRPRGRTNALARTCPVILAEATSTTHVNRCFTMPCAILTRRAASNRCRSEIVACHRRAEQTEASTVQVRASEFRDPTNGFGGPDEARVHCGLLAEVLGPGDLRQHLLPNLSVERDPRRVFLEQRSSCASDSCPSSGYRG